MCEYNGQEKCAHRQVLDADEIQRKTVELKNMLVEDAQRIAGDPSIQLVDLLPEEPVECLDGHIDGKLKWKQIELRDTIAADGTMGLPLSEYIRHLRHSEERSDVDKQTTVNYHPEAEFRDTQVTNIDFVTGSDRMQDNTFKSNVRSSLNLRGYKTGNGTLPPDVADQVALLRKRLIIGSVLRKTRSALKIDEGARPTRYANPGECIPCHLHAKN